MKKDLKSNLILFLKTLINCSPTNSPTYSVPLCVLLLLRSELQLAAWAGGGARVEALLCCWAAQGDHLSSLIHRTGLSLVERKKLIGSEKDLEPLVVWTL